MRQFDSGGPVGAKGGSHFVLPGPPDQGARARVVKGWNHVFAKYLTAPEVDGIASSVLLAGDDPEAKRIVSALARDMGFHPVDVGRLRESYHLDRLVSMILFVKLGPFRVLTPPS
jgi:predicted dinucleotide-binding enzyme